MDHNGFTNIHNKWRMLKYAIGLSFYTSPWISGFPSRSQSPGSLFVFKLKKPRRVESRTRSEDPVLFVLGPLLDPVATFNSGEPGEDLVEFTHMCAMNKGQVPVSGDWKLSQARSSSLGGWVSRPVEAELHEAFLLDKLRSALPCSVPNPHTT